MQVSLNMPEMLSPINLFSFFLFYVQRGFDSFKRFFFPDLSIVVVKVDYQNENILKFAISGEKTK